MPGPLAIRPYSPCLGEDCILIFFHAIPIPICILELLTLSLSLKTETEHRRGRTGDGIFPLGFSPGRFVALTVGCRVAFCIVGQSQSLVWESFLVAGLLNTSFPG
jgi:hypothetical protein